MKKLASQSKKNFGGSFARMSEEGKKNCHEKKLAAITDVKINIINFKKFKPKTVPLNFICKIKTRSNYF